MNDRPIVAVDIDGTLAEYHVWFLKFAELWYGKPMPAPTDINPMQPLWKFMGVTKASYRECKLAYRQGGMKRSMPCLEGAAEMLRVVRRKACLRNTYANSDMDYCRKHGLGAEVWICTTRPFLRLDNIDPDTREWLRRNRITFDALLFDPIGGDRKYYELFRQAGKRVACVLEDLPEQASIPLSVRYSSLQVPVLLRNQPYNRTWNADGNCFRWDTADQALSLIEQAVANWRIRNG
jgi:hypothetical protein